MHMLAIAFTTGNDISSMMRRYDENASEFWEYDDDGDETGYNPDGRFDYYRIGGRFAGAITAKAGKRAKLCWEIEEWKKSHPGEPVYRDDQYDIADVDDIIECPRPFAVVLPDGEWLDRGEFDIGKVLESLKGLGVKAYAVDFHD